MNGASNTNNLIVLLAVLPMVAAILTIALRRAKGAQRLVGLVSLGLTALLAGAWTVEAVTGGPLVSQMGGWPAPFGITIALDALSGLMITAASIVALACLVFSIGTFEERDRRGWWHPLVHLLAMGVNFSFLTGDLFNLFVAFEIMLMSSYALLVLGGTRRQISQAYKYVVLNLIGSTLFVIGAGLVYGMMGTLNFADLALMVAQARTGAGPPLPAAFPAVATLLLFVFAIKAAAFPLWFWLPDTYHTCPIGVGALFAGLLTKVGVYSILRLYPMIFAGEGVRDAGPAVTILLIAAAGTMLLAAVAALGVSNLRRVLALLLISSIGFQLFGAAMMTGDALAGATFYMAQSMAATAAAFLCCGLVERIGGSDDLYRLGGLQKKAPWLSVLFFVVMITLIGLPPLSGFYGKALILREGFAGPADRLWWVVSVCGLLAGVATLLALARVWAMAFWSEASDDGRRTGSEASISMRPAYAGVTLLVGVIAAVSVGAEPLLRASRAVGAGLNEPKEYVTAVLPGAQWPEKAADIATAHERMEDASR